jgi:hypothetical protein
MQSPTLFGRDQEIRLCPQVILKGVSFQRRLEAPLSEATLLKTTLPKTSLVDKRGLFNMRVVLEGSLKRGIAF